MPAVQLQFDQFHDRIKLDEDDEKANLREKRDILIEALRASLPHDVPSFEPFHQGSYSMHTGVVPLDGNYDIDVGVIFDCKRERYPDPVALKKKVRDALDSNNRTVAIRQCCVTVNYMRDGKPDFHVDFAIYAKRNDSFLDLARGKESSDAKGRFWEASDPKRLTALICTRYSDARLAQYRRCIRYSKRWRDAQFVSGAPLSIALTVAAYEWFQPYQTINGTFIDLLAMLNWCEAMLAQFRLDTTAEGPHQRLKILLPVEPWNDLLAELTRSQMEQFRLKLSALRDALRAAYDGTLPEEACQRLSEQFGDEFPVPAKTETARTVVPPYVHTGSSA